MFLSVVIPTINEEKSIGGTIQKIKHHLRGMRHEIIVVDTNSTDRTVQIARSLGARIVSEPRKGYGYAYKNGFRSARGEIIVTLDADSTYPAESIRSLLGILEKDRMDFISGRRISENGMTLLHRFGNWTITSWANILFGTRFRDSQSGMWVFRKSLLRKMTLLDNRWPFSGEIKIEAARHGRFKEVPIVYRKREGLSKVSSFSVGAENIKFLFKKRFFPATLQSADGARRKG
jgi:glycosyltransferase involved in cell wall biosynthesis